MEFRPYYYQRFTKQFIIDHPFAGLFIDMGMGKTVVTLSAIKELKYDYFAINKVLVIAPLRPAKETWPCEIKKWDHINDLTSTCVLGSAAERLSALEKDVDIYIINRENVVWLTEYYKQRWPFDAVVIDELSSFKSNKAERFRALKRVRKYITRIVGLTGTPAPNNLLDLWPEMFLLDEGMSLGKTLTGFRNQFFVPDKRNRDIVYSWKPKPNAEEEIYKLIAPVCVSMKSSDYLRLPERIFSRREFNLESMDTYKKLERDMVLPFAEGDIDAPTAAVLTNKLLQLSGGAVYDEYGKTHIFNNEKLDVLEELVEEANNQNILLFYMFKHEKNRILERFKDARDISEPGIIDEWNRGKIKMLVAHPASAGHGLNLQFGGHIIVWFGLPTSLELYQQANKRLHRPGQKHPVLIQLLIAKGTYDERVLDCILATKERNQNALVEALRAKIKEVANE